MEKPSGAMTVGELIKELSQMDQDRIVVQQDDSEGNGYRLVRGVDDNAAYTPESGWNGAVARQRLTTDDIAGGFTKEDLASDDAIPCVVIFPIN